MSTISFNMYDKIDESRDVSKLLGVPFPIKLCNLRILWESGFGIYNLYCVEDGNDYNAGMWLCTSTKFLPHKLTVSQYNLWLSILYQISKIPVIPVLISAPAEESSVNSYVANSLYKRSLCCISAQRESNKVEKNVKDHKELGDLPELNTDFPWTRVEKNIYKNNAGTFKFVVSKNNVLHYGYESTILQARLKVKAIKEGKAVKCFRRTLIGDTYFGTHLPSNRSIF